MEIEEIIKNTDFSGDDWIMAFLLFMYNSFEKKEDDVNVQ